MQVTIYSTTTCPYCDQLKDYLKQKNIGFAEKLIDQDEKARTEMEQTSGGFLGVPFIHIRKDDGSSESILGFDKGKLASILGIA